MGAVTEPPPHLSLPERALLRAVVAHAGQRRKESAAPYVVHPTDVMKRVAHFGIRDDELLAAAALHDVVEDTEVTLDELRGEFGPRVAELVDRLSHDPERDGSKQRYLETIAAGPVDVLVVKLADRASNVDDYLMASPHYAPVYAAKATVIYRAILDRAAELESRLGPHIAGALAREARRLSAL